MLSIALPPAGADKQPTVNLAPGGSFTHASKRPMAAASPLINSPAQCEGAPWSVGCDVFYLKLALDDHPEAFNFVTAQLSWDPGARPPPLAAVVLGLQFGSAIDYSMYLYQKDEKGAWVRRTDISGGLANPEMIGFQATAADYAIVVQNIQGSSTAYTFTVNFSNERFSSPFEVLDPAFSGGGGSFNQPPPADLSADPPAQAAPAFAPPDGAGVDAPGADGAVVVRDFQPIAPDSDFAGFRGNVDNTLAGLSGVPAANQRPAPAVGDPPPLAIALFWLLALPLAAVVLIAAWARRRRPAALD